MPMPGGGPYMPIGESEVVPKIISIAASIMGERGFCIRPEKGSAMWGRLTVGKHGWNGEVPERLEEVGADFGDYLPEVELECCERVACHNFILINGYK